MNISRNLILSILILSLSVTNAFGQSTLGAAGVINGIKLSDDFLYAEFTSSEWREACDNATDILRMKVEDWLSENESETDVDSIMVTKKVIRARRAELYRAFIYVEKPETINPSVAEDSAEDSVATVSEEVPVSSISLTSDEQVMLEVRSFTQIEPFISGLRVKNVIRDFGKYATMPEENCYLFVYNREGNVVAAIRKEGAGQTNLETGEKDDVSSYKGCGAIWFRMK